MLINIFGFKERIHNKVVQLKESDIRDLSKYTTRTNKRLQKEKGMEKQEKK